jgi:hypothetical protein
MGRFVEGESHCLDDYVGEDNLVRVVDVFIDELDLATLGFAGPAATGRRGLVTVTRTSTHQEPTTRHGSCFRNSSVPFGISSGSEDPQCGSRDEVALKVEG